MKRLGKAQSEKLKSVCLYKDDIAEIVEIFNRGCEKVEIEAAGYQLDCVSELENLGKETISELYIKGRNPCVYLHFRPNEIFLYIDEDTHHQMGLFEDIKTYVHSKRRKLSWLIQTPIAPSILGGSAFRFIPLEKGEVTTHAVVLVISMLSLAIFWGWWSFHSSFKKYSIIYTKRSRKDGGFIKRKKDDLLLIFISALVSAVITLAITKVFSL
ncbi:hypothetical protein [Vibrio cholerae]|uniref:hypothetical protein n=1 Tax=Vibrio cholerae TaxID=666 RepID=UPI00330BFC8B|nr:hypothetical protein [Vibrio cholerae]HCJ7274032.1 hypothetical protein [Vibrio cholerae]HCJ7281265.1 hypothetical protein [Vibrio cholerae]HCJ7319037.1 hypothetical protein [Vibrio cholerae]HDI3182576.1 hypothetical protein [Vibrio cholerae]